jgi:hypothetical protein
MTNEQREPGEKTEETLVRKCRSCAMTVHDNLPDAEWPGEVCD